MTHFLSSDTLVDRIYEAALVPELWPGILAQMSSSADCEGGILFVANQEHTRWTASPDIHDRFLVYLNDGWAARNPRLARMSAKNHAGFLRDNDCFTAEELDNDPVYTLFWRKCGLGWNTGTLLAAPTGDHLIFTFEKAFDKGPFDLSAVSLLDSIRPHLARAALLSARLGLERSRAMTAVLGTLGIPGAVLRKCGSIVAANPLLENLMPSLVQDRRQRVRLTDAGADALLDVALTRSVGADYRQAVCSIPVAADETRPAMIVHLIPIRGAANDIFSLASSLLIVTPVDRAAVPTASVLQGLFDLTPAEARVARGIVESHTVDELASALGISRETVRTQLKAVLSKTGTSRQTELVGLLAGTQSIDPAASQ